MIVVAIYRLCVTDRLNFIERWDVGYEAWRASVVPVRLVDGVLHTDVEIVALASLSLLVQQMAR